MDWCHAAPLVLVAGLVLAGPGPDDGRKKGAPVARHERPVAVEMTPAAEAAVAQDTPLVAMETSLGTMVLELYPWKAPVTVDNFLTYVEKGFYTGLIFHRVIPDFVIQGGGLTRSLRKASTLPPIENESDNGLSNERGTIAMAREADPNSARSQFYINLADNTSLDFKGPSSDGWGYTVFGRVREGMDVSDAISRVETGVLNGMPDVPLETIMIRKMQVLED